MAFEQPFRIEISKDGKNITFGPRRPNETGRDILAIKIALGLVQTSDGAPSAPQGESNSESEVALDSQKWFDCGTGLGMDTKQASTYDSRLRNALVNYQIQNQFLIICYLIEKFGLRDLIGQTSVNTEFDILNSNIPKEYDQSLMKMVESSIILFDSELGLMGEATLAVLHGWVPHSTFTNTGYAHVSLIGQETVYDVIHIALARQLHSNFTQTYQEMVSAGLCVQGGFVYNDVDKLNQYLQYASDNTNWTRMRGEYNPFVTNREVQRFQYGVLEYVKKVPSETSSLLYSAAISVIDNSPVLTPNEEYGDNPQSSAEKIENLKRMYFPDPFTDPAPFDIDDDRVGYFLETEYQLKSDNLPSEEEDTIRDLEQKALEQVFDARGLPTIWYTNRSARLVDNTNEIENNNINYFGNSASPTPNHNGYYPYSDEFRSRSNFEAAIEFKKYYEYSELKRRFDFNVTARDKALEDFNEGNWLGRDETIHGAIYKSTGFIEEVELGSWSSPARSRGKIRNAYDNANAEITEAMLNWPTQEYNKESFYVLALKEDEAMISQGYAQHWREIDSVGTTEPLIKFVEYRTPSLRPNQKYRALFYINKRKLETIKNEVIRGAGSDTASSTSNATSTSGLEPCADENTSQSLRRYQEYKAYAIKTRNEIVKKFREEAKNLNYADNYRGARIDLGQAGPFDLNEAFNPFGGGMTSGMAYTEKVFSKLIGEDGSLLSGIGVTGTDMDQMESILKNSDQGQINQSGLPPGIENEIPGVGENSIKISLEDLRVRVKIMSEDLRDAGEEIKGGVITFEPGSNFDAKRESNYINEFLMELEILLEEVDKDVSDKPETEITFKFAAAETKSKIGPKIGKTLTSIIANVPGNLDSKDQSDTEAASIKTKQAVIKKYEGDTLDTLLNNHTYLRRPRTVNYISRVYDMTTRYLPEGSYTKSFFEDSRGSCKDLGIDLKKTLGISYIGKYTSGLKAKAEKGQTAFEAIERWTDDSIISPFNDWVSASADNMSRSNPFDDNNDFFDESAALKMMGEMCEWEDVYKAIFDKLDFASLLCDYLKCIKLPGFDIKLPSFYLPPLPKIPIIGWMGEIYKFIVEKFGEIINRLLCTVAKMLIDKMTIPFCEEQLREFVAAGSSAGPLWNQAFADSLLLTGITEGQKEQAKDFFEDSVSILTRDELCRLLKGQPLDRATTRALLKLVQNRGLDLALETEEDVLNFFSVLYQYLPADLCEALERPQMRIKDCDDPQDLIAAVRNQLLSDDPNISEEDLNNALEIAKKNREDIAEQLKTFSGSEIDSLAPNFFEMGNPAAIVSDYPPYLKNQMNKSMSTIFEPARSSYITTLGTFIPSMRVLSPHSPRAGDEDYDALEVMKLESALHQLSSFTYYRDKVSQKYIDGNQQEIPALREIAATAADKISRLKQIKRDIIEYRNEVTPIWEDYLETYDKWNRTELAGGPFANQQGLVFNPTNAQHNLMMNELNPKRRKLVAKYTDERLVQEPNVAMNARYWRDGDGQPDLNENSGWQGTGRFSVVDASPSRAIGGDGNLNVGNRRMYNLSDSRWVPPDHADQVTFNYREDGTLDYEAYHDNVKIFYDDLVDTSQSTLDYIDSLIVELGRESRDAGKAIADAATPPPITMEEVALLFVLYKTKTIGDPLEGDRVYQYYLPLNQKNNPEDRDNWETVQPVSLDGQGYNNPSKSRTRTFLSQISESAPPTVDYNTRIDSLLDPKNNDEFATTFRWFIRTSATVPTPATEDTDATTTFTGILPILSTSEILDWIYIAGYPTPIPGLPAGYPTIGDYVSSRTAISETKQFYKDYAGEEPGSPKLNNLVASRVNFLSNQINEILQRRSNNNIELHLPYIREAFKWQSEDAIDDEGEEQNFVTYFGRQNELKLNFQAGVYSPSVSMQEVEKDGNFDRYDITVKGDFFLNQIPEDEVTFKYCDEIPQDSTNYRLVLGESTNRGNNFTKREAWASFLFDKMADQFGSDKLAKNLTQAEKSDVLLKLAEKNFEQVTEKSMEQVMFSLYNSRFFDGEYAENLDDRISGKPVYKQSCVSNRFGISEASVLAFDKVVLGDPAAEIALESMKPENSPFNRDFDTPGPFEKALKTISVKAFIRACLIEILLKGGIAYASWDIEPIISEKFFVDYVLKNIETELDNNANLKGLWRKTLERSESISSPKQALRTFVTTEMMKLPNYSKEIFNPNQPKRDFFEWEVGDILPMVDPPSFILDRDLRTFTSSGGRRDLPVTRHGQRRFHVEEYIVTTAKQETRDLLWNLGLFGQIKFPLGVHTIPYFRDKFVEWYDDVKSHNANQLTITMVKINEVLNSIKVEHRCRLILLEAPHIPGLPTDRGYIRQVTEDHFGTREALTGRSVRDLKGYVNAKLTDNVGDTENVTVMTVDLARVSRDISPANCRALWQEDYSGQLAGRDIKILSNLQEEDTKRYMRRLLAENKDFQFVMNTVFPIRRFMSIASVYSTSILSGYSAVPDVMNSAKVMISAIAKIADTPRRLQDELTGINQSTFQDFIKKNFPSDPSDPSCIDFPGIGADFFNKFFSDLWDLFKMLPSIILRGIAFQLEPGYKEMRTHYLNCDIEKLKIEKLAGSTVDSKLVNGLRVGKGGHGNNNGKYASLLSAPVDLVHSFANPWKLPKRLEKTILKTISYVYSGGAPFVDLNSVFKIPCLKVDKNYLEGEKYDFGKYGRYGHPMGPFALFALMTPELDMDKKMKQGKCEPKPTIPCEDIENETT